jgi:hypothetical protein
MAIDDGTEAIEDSEVVFRRVPVSQGWCDAAVQPHLSHLAFAPTKYDVTGISLSRAKYKTVEQAAAGSSRQGYYVALLKAGDLRSKGIDVVPKPLPDDPGHCEIPSLIYQNRRTDPSIETTVQLALLVIDVKGPFAAGLASGDVP